MSYSKKRKCLQAERQPKSIFSLSICCVDKMAQYQPKPRLTRLDNNRHAYIVSTPTSLISTNLKESEPPNSKMEESLHLRDLELMMHWCTTTYRSMARNSTGEVLWQTVIPQLALRYPSLRHGLLALSALQLADHYADICPHRKRRYLISARDHQRQALAGIQIHGAEDCSATPSNAHFALCCTMVVFSFAYCLIDDADDEDDESEQPDILDEFIELFHLTRWLVSAMQLSIDRVATGELSSLLEPEEPMPTMPNMTRLVMLPLQRLNENEALRDPAHEKDVYGKTIEYLTLTLEQLMNRGDPTYFAFCWAFQIPVRFLDLLHERQPFALVVLAHYAVILHGIRDLWWMGDWGLRILKKIGSELDPEWRQLISWPIDATGCDVPSP
ncbi:hypothetical protein N7495_003123 [Penicillium taxi]|uniref:uncharacterized protein n=1 Tax=Penicillium taxi TaxID=168475 RepID=UPI0025455224|nr:uncharacterized protein N7495_003123 [Penicillium taxi]KAJ5902595.1 hypothetical protein N7495_003123 [Penicillium taxi]